MICPCLPALSDSLPNSTSPAWGSYPHPAARRPSRYMDDHSRAGEQYLTKSDWCKPTHMDSFVSGREIKAEYAQMHMPMLRRTGVPVLWLIRDISLAFWLAREAPCLYATLKPGEDNVAECFIDTFTLSHSKIFNFSYTSFTSKIFLALYLGINSMEPHITLAFLPLHINVVFPPVWYTIWVITKRVGVEMEKKKEQQWKSRKT